MSEKQKIKDKSLCELGLEYEKHIALQQQFIDKCNEEIKKAQKSGDFEAEAELKSKRRVFYQIKEELSETAKALKNYYKNSKGEINGKQNYFY